MQFWSIPTLWYTDPHPLYWTSRQWICTNHPRQNWLPCLPIRNTRYQAFTANDFVFYNKNCHVLKKIDNSSLDLATSVQITWSIQKNNQHGQKIKLSVDTKNPTICPVRGALQMVMRAHHLAQPDNMPVACYCRKKRYQPALPLGAVPWRPC